MQISSCSEKGNKRENQDQVLILEQQDWTVLGVLDGHGDYGLKCASYIRQRMTNDFPAILSRISVLVSGQDNTNLLTEGIKKEFGEYYAKLDEDLLDGSGIDCYISGTTATLTLVHSRYIITVHIGDCRAILCRRPLSQNAEISNGELVQLTTDHNCELQTEAARLTQSGATLQKLMNESGTAFEGPLRIFKGSLPYPGLTVSRSFGDQVAKRLGVITEPEVHVLKRDGSEDWIILASDGVWDAMNAERVREIVHKDRGHKDCAQLSRRITYASLKSLVRLQLDDNVTNVLAFF